MIIERGTDPLISITQRNLRLVQQEWLKIKNVGSIGEKEFTVKWIYGFCLYPRTVFVGKRICVLSSIDTMIVLFFSDFIYLFHNDYKTSNVTYTNHSRWLWDPRSCDLRVAGNRSTRNKPTCPTWWPHDHHTCRRVFVNVNVCICHLL